MSVPSGFYIELNAEFLKDKNVQDPNFDHCYYLHADNTL